MAGRGNGHWEERRKIEASSIGAVIAELRELRLLLAKDAAHPPCFGGTTVTPDFLDRLIAAGSPLDPRKRAAL